MICKKPKAPMNLELCTNMFLIELQSPLAPLSWNRRHDGILASVGWDEEYKVSSIRFIDSSR